MNKEAEIHSFTSVCTNSQMYCNSSIVVRRNAYNQSRFSDLAELRPSSAFHNDTAVDLSQSFIYNEKSDNLAVVPNIFGDLNGNVGSSEIASSAQRIVETGQLMLHKASTTMAPLANGHFENWGESAMADNSQQTDTSTDVDTDDKHQVHGVKDGGLISIDSIDHSNIKSGDQKTLRRLAQNREAARKSRLRKKVLVLDRHMFSSWRIAGSSLHN